MEIKMIFTLCSLVLTAVFILFYMYQFFYIFWVFLGKDKSRPVKSDKLNKTEFKNRLEEIKQELCEFGSDFPIIPFSSLKGIGVDDVKKVIEDSLK